MFIQTNPHRTDEAWHSEQRAGHIEPTSDTMALVGEAVRLLCPLWRGGHRYHKAGVVVSDLVPQGRQPGVMFASRDPVRSTKVMQLLDAVNERHGRGMLRVLAAGTGKAWSPRHERLSPCYTTRRPEILEATAR